MLIGRVFRVVKHLYMSVILYKKCLEHPTPTCGYTPHRVQGLNPCARCGWQNSMRSIYSRRGIPSLPRRVEPALTPHTIPATCDSLCPWYWKQDKLQQRRARLRRVHEPRQRMIDNSPRTPDHGVYNNRRLSERIFALTRTPNPPLAAGDNYNLLCSINTSQYRSYRNIASCLKRPAAVRPVENAFKGTSISGILLLQF